MINKKSAIVILTLVALYLLGIYSIFQKEKQNTLENNMYYEGQHKLKRFGTIDSITKHSVSGSFFLFIGSINSETQQQILVRFCWQTINGDFQISQIPLTKIKFNINNSIEVPYIEFKYDLNEICSPINNCVIQDLIDKNVNAVIVYCNEKVYPDKINLSKI